MDERIIELLEEIQEKLERIIEILESGPDLDSTTNWECPDCGQALNSRTANDHRC